jgi:SagB-type dehydrogenase family enzyme
LIHVRPDAFSEWWEFQMRKKDGQLMKLTASVIKADIVMKMPFAAVIAVLVVASVRGHAVGADNMSIKLPQPKYDGVVSVEKALRERRSVREFGKNAIMLSDLTQLLWAAQGFTGSGGLRAAPSAGALYPLEVHVVAGNISGLEAGIYLYKPELHELLTITEGDKRTELCRAAFGQSAVKNGAVSLVISAVYERTTVKYGERGIRYAHMEAGHAAENVYLQAVSLNLGTVTIGAFDDNAVKKVVKLTKREQPLYIMPIGKTEGR